MSQISTTDWDVIIAGSGVAGLSAAIYTSRSDLKTLVLQGTEPGGQLTLTSEIANYPGFPEAVGGYELIENMRTQAEKFGAIVESGVVNTLRKNSGDFEAVLDTDTVVSSQAFIVASGASARTLGVEGEDQYMGNGLSTCATCDGAFFQGEDMVVIGGGDSAMEEAVFLTKFADTVHIVHRRDNWRAEQYLINQMEQKKSEGDIVVHYNTEVTQITGSESSVDGVQIVTHPEGKPTQKPSQEVTSDSISCGAVFYAIGHTPNTDYLSELPVSMDDRGYVLTQGGRGGMQTATNIEGLFAAGDVVDTYYQQAATASGMGVKASMDVEEYLS